MDWAMKLTRELRELEKDIKWIRKQALRLGDRNLETLLNEAFRRRDSMISELANHLDSK